MRRISVPGGRPAVLGIVQLCLYTLWLGKGSRLPVARPTRRRAPWCRALANRPLQSFAAQVSGDVVMFTA